MTLTGHHAITTSTITTEHNTSNTITSNILSKSSSKEDHVTVTDNESTKDIDNNHVKYPYHEVQTPLTSDLNIIVPFCGSGILQYEIYIIL
jgi:hypothetical protein